MPRIVSGLLSVGSLGALGAGMVLIDPTLGEKVGGILATAGSMSATLRIQQSTRMISGVVGEHTSLVMLVMASVTLVAFMRRT